MLAQEVARKYAHGLFLTVEERQQIDQAHQQLQQLGDYIAKDDTLLNFLQAPNVLDEHKLALVQDVFTDRIDRLYVEFLLVLIRKHRIGYLPEIVDEFIRLVEAAKGIARVTVITAVPLVDAERDKLKTRLHERTDKTIELEEKVDRAIIGGMIIIMYNEIIDGSIRRGLDLIEEGLAKVRVH